MKLKVKLPENFWGGILGAFFVFVIGFSMMNFGFKIINLRLPEFTVGHKLIDLSYDLPCLPRKIVIPEDIVIVYMDDQSHKELKQPFNAPWDRAIHARLVERLTADGARAVVFDVIFSDPGPDPAADEHLAKAMKANGKVILGADYVPAGYGTTAGRIWVRPIDTFLDGAASYGMVQLKPGSDFTVREHFHGFNGEEVPSMTWAAARMLGAPVTKGPDLRFVERWVNYYGPPHALPSISYYQALDPGFLLPGYFSNKVAFIGVAPTTGFTGERRDEYRSPYSVTSKDFNQFMPGVEVHATILLNLLRRDWLTRFDMATEMALIVVGGLFFGFGFTMLRPLVVTQVALVTAAAIVFFGYYLFWQKLLWFSWLTLVTMQVGVGWFWSVTFNSFRLYVQKRLLTQSLEMYLSPKLVKKFANRPELLKPGAEKQELSILFSDIAGFTTFSEGMDSDKLAQVMNRYFETAVTKCIHVTDGTVVKFIGDAIFALWNAPELQQDHQERACRAALLLATNIVHFTSGATGVQLRTRIGLHTGVANVGNFGSSTRVDYTALGENINLAARMEGLNKYLGTSVLITSDVERGVNGKFVTRRAGRFVLKGFEKSVTVHELVNTADQAEDTRSWRETFDAALKEFERGNFDAAEAGFNHTIELHPGDGPSNFFLKQLDEYRASPPPAGWTGEIELKEK